MACALNKLTVRGVAVLKAPGRQARTILAARMKAGVDHVAPLSDATVVVLAQIKPSSFIDTTRVFGFGGAARSNVAMQMLSHRMK